jgi:hypothetical protein
MVIDVLQTTVDVLRRATNQAYLSESGEGVIPDTPTLEEAQFKLCELVAMNFVEPGWSLSDDEEYRDYQDDDEQEEDEEGEGA